RSKRNGKKKKPSSKNNGNGKKNSIGCGLSSSAQRVAANSPRRVSFSTEEFLNWKRNSRMLSRGAHAPRVFRPAPRRTAGKILRRGRRRQPAGARALPREDCCAKK